MMNDLVDALKTRLSSPIFGYFGLALLAFNWQAVFFLLVQDGDVLTRIRFFEQHTTTASLIILPCLFAISFSVLYPWLLFLVARMTAKPSELKDMVQANSEHRVLIRRKQLEEARSSILANAEMELIERAKRDQELDKFQNEELRQKLKAELEQLRAERDSLREQNQSHSLNEVAQHKELMDLAGTYRAKAEDPTAGINDRERFTKCARELEEKAYLLLLNSELMGQSQTGNIRSKY